MIRFLIGRVIPVLFVLIAGLVGYFYFFGNARQQERSQEIIQQVRGLGESIVSLLREEGTQENLDGAMESIGTSLGKLREYVISVHDTEHESKLAELEQEFTDLSLELDNLRTHPPNNREAEQAKSLIESRIEELARCTEQLGVECASGQ